MLKNNLKERKAVKLTDGQAGSLTKSWVNGEKGEQTDTQTRQNKA